MTQEEVRAQLDKMTKTKERHMLATTAYHFLADISSDEFDLIYVYSETDDFWVGNWVTGFGFINVLFPKTTTRDLTPQEVAEYNQLSLQLASNAPQKLTIIQ